MICDARTQRNSMPVLEGRHNRRHLISLWKNATQNDRQA